MCACYVREICRQFFGSSFSDVNGVQKERTERPDVEALWKYPCPAACASRRRQPSLFGDDTHAVVTRPKWHGEHGPHRVWYFVLVVCKPGPSIGARARTRAKVNVRLRHLAHKDNRHKERAARRRDHKSAGL